MPKNKGKGGKNRRRGKNDNENEKRELVFREDGQEYAQVIKMLGNGRLDALCFDGVKRMCHIRGKLRKKVWINTGDIILLGLRDYQNNKADVIQKYTPDEARNLKTYGELPESAKLSDNLFDEDNQDEIEFQNDYDGGNDHIDNEINMSENMAECPAECIRRKDCTKDTEDISTERRIEAAPLVSTAECIRRKHCTKDTEDISTERRIEAAPLVWYSFDSN